MRLIFAAAITLAALFLLPAAFAEDMTTLPKGITMDMTAPLVDTDNTNIKDCPAAFDLKNDPDMKGCPPLTIWMAMSYSVDFPLDSDRTADFKLKARMRAVLALTSGAKSASLTDADAGNLMARVGNFYKLVGRGDRVIIACMKILDPAAYNALIK